MRAYFSLLRSYHSGSVACPIFQVRAWLPHPPGACLAAIEQVRCGCNCDKLTMAHLGRHRRC